MQATAAQEKFLNSFVCERLSSSPENEELVNKFSNHRPNSSGVMERFRHWAFCEDKIGNLAYYAVKYEGLGLVLLFALRCGEVFKPFNTTEQKRSIDTYKQIEEILIAESDSGKICINESTIARMQTLLNLSQGDDPYILEHILEKIKAKKEEGERQLELIDRIREDQLVDDNKKIQRVNIVYPAVELTYFYTNDANKTKIKELFLANNIVHPVGEVLFWKFIVPIVQKIPSLVGCEYLFLYAADDSENKTLVNYYASLKFEDEDSIGNNKPESDFQCKFMYQTISSLEEKRMNFLANFNDEYV